jgi:hypothetical protein
MVGSSFSRNPEELAFAVRMLLKYNQQFQAFRALVAALHQETPIDPGLVIDALEGRQSVADDNKELASCTHYEIAQLFWELQQKARKNDARVDVQRLARLEGQYLRFLDGHLAWPHTLHRMLQSDPARFVELLTLIFRADRKAEPTEEEQALRQNAYCLFMSWHRVPGRQDDGTIDEEALQAWVEQARQLAQQQDLLAKCDSKIGEVLAHHDRSEEDGSWPCIPIRDALEEIGTEAVFDGFEVGIFNNRGASCKLANAGGDQERGIAQRYRGYADVCKIEWPKTAAALYRVAEGYEQQARREDAGVLLNQ